MSPDEKKLLKYYHEISNADRSTLLSFAQFLYEKTETKEIISQVPLDIERPENENVVAAIKRLRKTYPMLEPSSVLNQSSDLLSKHMLLGKDRIETINELESLFKAKYSEFRGDNL